MATLAERLRRLAERVAEEALPENICKRLYSYTRGAKITFSEDIRKYFEEYIPKRPFLVFRGMAFLPKDAKSAAKSLGLSIEEVVAGNSATIKSSKVSSWTFSEKVATEFSNVKVPSGMITRNAPSVGIVVKMMVDPENVIIPLAKLPYKKFRSCVHYLNASEQEILIAKGTYTTEIVTAITTGNKKIDETKWNLKLFE